MQRVLEKHSNLDLREILNGEKLVAPSPFGIHQMVVLNLARLFSDYLEKLDSGKILIAPLDVILEPEKTILQPDLIFLQKDNLHILKDWIRGVPDLVIEVVPKTILTRDRVKKKAVYEQFGVKEFWLVFPEQACIEIFILENGVYKLFSASDLNSGKENSRLLKDFSVTNDQVFPK
jgi:Uma2 family endonuclease